MSSPPRKRVAVFCGSKSGAKTVYSDHVATLGNLLGENNIDIVYGGSYKGLMGVLANHALIKGSKVTGIIPEVLINREHQHEGLTELIITSDMHQRKKTMYEMGDAGIVLPGGFGTLDEFFEMLTWNQLSIHNKKIFILNSGGFYSRLIEHLEFLEKEEFLHDQVWNRLEQHDNPVSLVNSLCKSFGN